MSLKLSVEMLVASYEFLRTTEPFKGWHLPEAEGIKFQVIKDPKCFADFSVENHVPIIRISAAKNGHVDTLLATMAHEMCHLRQEQISDPVTHGQAFKAMARRVCRAHGYDPKTF